MSQGDKIEKLNHPNRNANKQKETDNVVIVLARRRKLLRLDTSKMTATNPLENAKHQALTLIGFTNHW